MGRRPRHDVRLDADDLAALADLAAGTDQRATRAKIVLAAAAGATGAAIAAELGILPKTVSLWRSRYADCGLAGLEDAPRRSRPAEVAERAVLTALTSSPPAPDFSPPQAWTAALMAKELGVHTSTISRIWAEVGLDLRRAGVILPGVDPVHHNRRRTIAGWHVAPQHQAIALWISDTASRRWPTPPSARQIGAAWEAAGELLGAVDHLANRATQQDRRFVSAAVDTHLAEMRAVAPPGTRLWMLLDRPPAALDPSTRQVLASAADLDVRYAPSTRAWRAVVHRMLGALVADQSRRGRAAVDLRVCAAQLLSQAHRPAGAVPPVLTWHTSREAAVTGLAAFDRPAPRLPRGTRSTEPSAAWVSLKSRRSGDSRYEFPSRPAVALEHLHRHARDLDVAAADVEDALVLLQAHWRHLDSLERTLFAALRSANGTASDLVDVLDLDPHGVRARAARFRRGLPARGSAVRRRAAHARDRRSPGDHGPGTLSEDDMRMSRLTQHTAEEVGEHLHARWVRTHDGEDTRSVPGPQEYLEIVEYIVGRHRSGGPSMALDVRVGEIRAGFWLLSLLRDQCQRLVVSWVRHGRGLGMEWSVLGASSSRSGEAMRNFMRWVAGGAEGRAGGLGQSPLQHRDAVAGELVGAGDAGELAEIVEDLLSVDHRSLMRRDPQLHASVTALDEVFEDADDEHPVATARIWLSVLLMELRYHETLGDHPTLRRAAVRAQAWADRRQIAGDQHR